MSKIIKGNKQNYYSYSGKSRSISRIVNSVQTAEGEGFLVNRAFPEEATQTSISKAAGITEVTIRNTCKALKIHSIF
jgi:transcription initiation factor TFIIIB Brf1 subunit/transcription initiation factor TFIIB